VNCQRLHNSCILRKPACQQLQLLRAAHRCCYVQLLHVRWQAQQLRWFHIFQVQLRQLPQLPYQLWKDIIICRCR
jgi:hypothetical protein